MREQYDHRPCPKCGKEVPVLLHVLVHTGHVPDCENTVPEWTKEWWCPRCVDFLLRASL